MGYSKKFLIYYSRNKSIDRIDSDVGYVLSNIQLVTKEINVMKSDMSHSHFIALCKLVAKKVSRCGIRTHAPLGRAS